jgi:hypothetical protein
MHSGPGYQDRDDLAACPLDNQPAHRWRREIVEDAAKGASARSETVERRIGT